MAVKKSLLGRPMTRGEWYSLSLAVVGGLMLLGAVLMFLVKTIKRRFYHSCDAQLRLSQAYREGFMREGGRLESHPWSQKGEDGSRSGGVGGGSGSNGSTKSGSGSNKSGHSNHPNQRLMRPEQKKYGGVVDQSCFGDQLVTNRMQLNSTKDHKYFQTTIQVVNQSEGYYNEESKVKQKTPQNEEKNTPIRAHLSIWYKDNVLSITIHSLWGLPRMRRNLSCDPYVKLTLLPDSSLVAKTRIMRRTQNPVFEEQFDFYDVASVDDVTVQLSVFTFDQYSKDFKIGEVVFPVVEVVEDGWVEDESCELDDRNVSEGRKEIDGEKRMINDWMKNEEIKNEIDEAEKDEDELCNKDKNALDYHKIIEDQDVNNNNKKNNNNNNEDLNNKKNNGDDRVEEKHRRDMAKGEKRDSFFKDLCVDVPTIPKVKTRSQRDNLLQSFGFYYN